MLASRVVTALILISLVVAGALYLSTPVLALIFALVVMIAGLEWIRLAGIQTTGGRVLFLVSLVAAMGTTGWLMFTDPRWAWWIALVAVVWWLMRL